MKRPLAIFAPTIGVRSETFIQRHIRDLLPGQTVTLTKYTDEVDGQYWSGDGSAFVLSEYQPHFGTRMLHRVARKAGHPLAEPTFKAARRFLIEQGVEVIMGEYLDESLTWLSVARDLGIRFFGHAHGYDVSYRLRDMKWRSEYLRYNQSDGVVTMSRFSRKRLAEIGIEESMIHVVPYGVNVPDAPVSRPTGNMVRCLAVGRMVAKKAPILMLDAFRRAVEAFPQMHLDCVGAGELLPAARQYVRAFNLGDRVTLHGSLPNPAIHDLMRQADMFLQHSMTDPEIGDEEGLPVAILEAMAHSLPVVSTRHAGIPEAVTDGVTGFLVDEGDSSEMAQRISALARSEELRLQFGSAGWQRAKVNFTWEQERASLLDILGLNPSK